jgi:hypothetical protein
MLHDNRRLLAHNATAQWHIGVRRLDALPALEADKMT